MFPQLCSVKSQSVGDAENMLLNLSIDGGYFVNVREAVNGARYAVSLQGLRSGFSFMPVSR